MKQFLILKVMVVFLLSLGAMVSDAKIPPDIAEVIAYQRTYSKGDGKLSMEDLAFNEYIRKNWREIADNIETLQEIGPPIRGGYNTAHDTFGGAVMTFGQACESLPPLEYLDFFEKMLSRSEEGRISFEAIEFLYMAEDEKDCFFSVNWEHPRVQKIFARFRKLIPQENVDLLSMLEDQSKGELADNYLTNKSDDAPLPETLPGIKLKRPWDSLIKKYERMTGNKVEVPYNSRYNPRPEKGSATAPASISEKTASALLNPWLWMISGGLVVIIGIAVKLSRSSKRRRKA